MVAKFTGAHDDGKLSWISWAYKPIYKLRSYVKENISPEACWHIKYVMVLVLCIRHSAFGPLF